jgi:hypothetical protein
MKSPRYQLPPRKWLAWITSLLAIAVIVWQVGHHQALSMQSLDWGQLSPNRSSLLAFAALLVPVNWGIEALKWHVLLERKRSSIGQSYREVIVGATWGFLTPNRSGDAVARVALLPAADRARGLRSFGWSAWSQAGMTLDVRSHGLDMDFECPFATDRNFSQRNFGAAIARGDWMRSELFRGSLLWAPSAGGPWDGQTIDLVKR